MNCRSMVAVWSQFTIYITIVGAKQIGIYSYHLTALTKVFFVLQCFVVGGKA